MRCTWYDLRLAYVVRYVAIQPSTFQLQNMHMGLSVCKLVLVANGVSYRRGRLQTVTPTLQIDTVCKYGELAVRPVCIMSYHLVRSAN